MPKISYNKKEKILSIRLGNQKSVDSDVRGNVVIDYDAAGRVVNVEIMQFSLNEFSRAADYFRQISNARKIKTFA